MNWHRVPRVVLAPLLGGIGGVGKTRVAVAAAQAVRNDFHDGVVFVPLASISDPALVMPTVAAALTVPDVRGQSRLATLTDYLRSRHLLLMLDNMEHIGDAAQDVAQLLAHCVDLHVLVTSRSPLHLRGEQEYPVEPLGVPDRGELIATERVTQYEAVAGVDLGIDPSTSSGQALLAGLERLDVPDFYQLFIPNATQMSCTDGRFVHDMVLTAAPGDPGY